ncbi:MAG: sarcosine oxidase subunit alpha [Rhizobiaceae bacterium]|nr:sarcosine oxidase subunit alpha [Rhizobiaceae bacterium]
MTTPKTNTGANRVAGKGRLSPSRTVSFTFDGKRLNAIEGDTLASALLANGIHLAGRSFKYHRPRGILAAGAEEPNALIEISRDNARRQPNVRATVQEVFDGMIAKSQNRFPSLEFDVGAVNDGLGRFFPAGFYYKTFMWPQKAWDKLYEPVIRNAAGLGEAPTEADPDHYANRYEHCEVLVIGGGPAGLAAALTAAQSGKRVMLVDENAEFGGSLLADAESTIDNQPASQWADAAYRTLSSLENVTLLNRTTAFGYYSQNMVTLVQRVTEHMARPDPDLPRERLWQVRAQQVILATGSIERHLVFPDNDRPGIMMASAAQVYLNRYGVIPGSNVAVYTACDSAWQAAFDLKEAGVNIPVIIDLREGVDAALLERATKLGIKVKTGHAVTGTSGRLRVRSIKIEPVNGTGAHEIAVDCLLMSGGWTPSVHLFSQSRGRVAFDEKTGAFLPDIYMDECESIGACNGTFDLGELLVEAQAAAVNAVASCGVKLRKPKAPKVENAPSMSGFHIGAAKGAGPDDFTKAFIDFQNDVTAKDIRLAVREGFHSIEHVKRYTTTGMATDQGKMSNMHGLAIAADTLGKSIPEVGLTTFRAPFTPVTFGALIGHARGELFDVTRRTPMHGWAEENGAVFEDVGNWKRAWYYPQTGEDMAAAVARECKTTREIAGIFDASTLGKIEVVGPDAVKFMNMMYTNPWDKLAVGRCRYGIMCREDGFIYDDGVVARLAEDRFHVTTTTGGAPRVLNMMEDYLQTEFPDWKVWLTSTSEQWAVIAVNGPKAREIIEPLVEGIDLANEAKPHMSVSHGKICGVETRLMRISFTGETGFEINVPADYGRSVWEAIWERGSKLGMCAYGTETMHVLRAEKGYIIVGQDTDGTVSPKDAGVAWAVGKKKTDFVGIKGMQRPDLIGPNRRELVGLKTLDPKVVLEEGAQIVDNPNHPVPMPMIGHVTSSYWSENLGHSIALALVENGHGRTGEKIFIPMPDETIAAEICSPIFFDPEGGRING